MQSPASNQPRPPHYYIDMQLIKDIGKTTTFSFFVVRLRKEPRKYVVDITLEF